MPVISVDAAQHGDEHPRIVVVNILAIEGHRRAGDSLKGALPPTG